MRTFLIALLAGTLLLAGCSPAGSGGTSSGAGGTSSGTSNPTKKYKIGVSLPSADHGWTAGAKWWAEQAMGMYNNQVDWVFSTADKPEKQIADIESMMAQGVECLVILATESAPLTPIAKQAHEKGILIVNVDRGFTEPVADVFIEGDNKSFGRKSAEFMVQKLGGKGKIIILEGVPCTVNTDRVTSATAVFKANPGIQIVGQASGKWSKDESLKVMETLLQQNKDVTAVWASDDDMALGAEQALKEAGLTNVWILGGAGMKDIVKRVMEKDPIYPADITYPPSMTAVAIQTAVGILRDGNKDKIMKFTPRHMVIDVDVITPENASQYYFPDSIF